MIFEQVVKIISEQLNIEEEGISPESDIHDDLGADSIDLVDIILEVEDEFDLEVADEVMDGIDTVGDIVKYIESVQ